MCSVSDMKPHVLNSFRNTNTLWCKCESLENLVTGRDIKCLAASWCFTALGFLDAPVHSVNLENVLKDTQKPQENTSFPWNHHCSKHSISVCPPVPHLRTEHGDSWAAQLKFCWILLNPEKKCRRCQVLQPSASRKPVMSSWNTSSEAKCSSELLEKLLKLLRL